MSTTDQTIPQNTTEDDATATQADEQPQDDQQATDQTEAAPEEDTEDTEPEAGGHAARDAAKYRKQLRTAEAQRDQLQAQVDALHKTMAEYALADKLEKPSALWLAGRKPADYFTDDGTLNVDQLTADADTAITELGLARGRRFRGSADGGVRTSTPLRRQPSWGDLVDNAPMR
jgi:cobalamin biosynthesis protein CobT